MAAIDPESPAFKGITKRELAEFKFLSREEKEALSMRLFGESLFGPPPWQKQRDQRWAALTEDTVTDGEPFRVSHEDLRRYLALTDRFRDKNQHSDRSARTTVSAFSDWVLRLYVPQRNHAALVAGINGEQAAVAFRQRIRRAKREIPRWEQTGWKLVHDGVRGEFDHAFVIPSLQVDGIPLTGVPDLVFREPHTGRILIVELKVSDAALPSDAWPNLRAQLWAYSRIERWISAPETILAGEIWSPESAGLRLRKTYRWKKGDRQLESDATELFQAYGGEVV